MRLVANSASRVELHDRLFDSLAIDSTCNESKVISRKQLLSRLKEVYAGHYLECLNPKAEESLRFSNVSTLEEFKFLESVVSELLNEKNKWDSIDLRDAFSGEKLREVIHALYQLLATDGIRISGDASWCIWSIAVVSHGLAMNRPKSMTWHFDSHYLPNYRKIHIGFNPYSGHAGGTVFLSEEDSELYVRKTNYSGSPISTRLSDLILENYKSRVIAYKSDLGSICSFYPNRNLHKGVWPEMGHRNSIFLSLCPVPYTERSDLLVNLTEKIIRYTDIHHSSKGIIRPTDTPVVLFQT
jgi:hypothetical protein